MANDYVAPGPGGFVVVVGGKQVGTYPDQSSAEQAFNNATGQSNAPPPADGGKTYNTPNGPKTLAQMKKALTDPPPLGAGYNGPTDDASIIAVYNSTANGTSAGAAGGAASASQKLLDAIASGDQQKFDEAVKEFDQNFGENKRQFDATLAEKSREFDTGNYTDLAKSLMNTATQIRGPKDYWQFNQFTSGGKDLMNQLYGNQPRPDFSAPTGPIEPETIADLMAKMGFTTSPIAGTADKVGAASPTANTPTPGTYTTVNGPRTVDQMYQELHKIGWGGSPTDTNAIVAAYAQTTGNPVTPQAANTVTPSSQNTVAPNTATPNTLTPNAATAPNTSPTQGAVTPVTGTPASQIPAVASGNGLSFGAPTIGANPAQPPAANTLTHSPSTAAPTGQQTVTPTSGGFPTLQPQPSGNQMVTPISGVLPPLQPKPAATGGQDVMGTSFPKLTPGGNPNTPGVKNVPLPYQINPAVFDALGQTGQDLLRSTAEAQGWDWNEYLRQLNASRPQGTAPGASTTSFSSPMGSFA